MTQETVLKIKINFLIKVC